MASGECGIALTNTYYLARLMRSDKPEDRPAMEKVGVVFPNQSDLGTHVNIAGAGVAKPARTGGRGAVSSNIWPAIGTEPISPTATTNGRRSASVKVEQPGAATRMGDFKIRNRSGGG